MRGNPLTVEHLTKLVRVLHKLAMVMNSKPWFSAGACSSQANLQLFLTMRPASRSFCCN